jgi:hypothetical protein
MVSSVVSRWECLPFPNGFCTKIWIGTDGAWAVTPVVRPSVRPATRSMGVVSKASAIGYRRRD